MDLFNLIERPWIPVVDQGVQRDASLRQVFERSDSLELSLANPPEMAAVLRQVLVPVCLRAFGAANDEYDWAERLTEPEVQPALAYIEGVKDRFDLFGPSCPFAQVAGLAATSGESKPSSLLRLDLPSGNNVPLFSERLETSAPPLTPAEAARALLAIQCWDTASIKTGAVGDPAVKKGKTTGNPIGPLGALGVVIPWGRNLWETLMLNCPIVPAGLRVDDRPQWEAAPANASWQERHALGVLDLLTWQSRRVRLLPTEVDGHTEVRSVIVAAGDRVLPPITDIEPHTLWKPADPKKADAPRVPRRHQPGRSGWRGLEAILAVENSETSLLVNQLGIADGKDRLPGDLAPLVVTVGVVYGNQNAIVEEVFSDQVPLPVQALRLDSVSRTAVLKVVRLAEDVRQAANHLQDDLRRSSGAEPIEWDKGSRAGDILITDLDTPTRLFLRGLQRDPDRAAQWQAAWKQVAHDQCIHLADALAKASPPTSFLGREHQRRTYRLANAVARYRRRIRQLLVDEDERGVNAS